MDTIIQSSRLQGETLAGRQKSKLRKNVYQKKVPGSPSQRRSLVQLQPCAGNQAKLVGKDGVIRLAAHRPKTPKRKRDGDDEIPCRKTAKMPRSKQFAVYDENVPESQAPQQKKTKKTPEEEAYELMVQEEVPDSYWEALAEERRVALEETLNENEELHGKVKDLEEENERLKVTADQAVYLADVVQELLGEKSKEEEDESCSDLAERKAEEDVDAQSIEIKQIELFDEDTEQKDNQENEKADDGANSEDEHR